MTADIMSRDVPCELCEEVDSHGYAITGSGSPAPGTAPGEAFSRLILRTSVADVLAGLGALTPGYALVIPHEHVASLGELGPRDMSRVFDLAWRVAERVRRRLGLASVLVEHGSSGVASGRRGSCIVHAHVHVFPLPRTAAQASFTPPGSRRITSLTSLRELARRHRNYYLSATAPQEGFIVADPQLPSQYARRQWAAELGEPDLWDWGAFPFIENARATAEVLRVDDEEEDECLIRETVLAYSGASAVYAARTRDFPLVSTLPVEIKELSRATRGTILDAGAGAGRDAASFAAGGREVIALDACLPLLRAAPPRAGVRRVAGDVRDLPLADASVGAIWCSAVLLHLPPHQLIRALGEFARVLTDDGLAQVSVKEGSGRSAEPFAGGLPFRRHFFYYQRDELLDHTRRAGVDVVRTWAEDAPDSGDRQQRWLKLLLRKRV
ncbi:methyltransferase domain-containing protein [Streptomyces sp. URMC 129]|uniref:methyltransferase domain-containing protein n=1 Tax=Streptomyces sp. URMC 129 TaxID=3423407 RepID=UPI003F1AAECB